MELLRARDENGHDWYIDPETKKAFPAIAGGYGSLSLVSPEQCPRHKSSELQYLYDDELDDQFGVAVMYCPAVECDYVSPRAIGLEPGPLDVKKNELLLMTAARQKVFFNKFVDHFVSNGK